MWKITWGGKSWTEEDLLVGHVGAIMLLQGVDDWSFCNPAGGPMKLMGVIAALVSRDSDSDPVEVLAALGDLPAVDLLAALSFVDDAAEVVTEPTEE